MKTVIIKLGGAAITDKHCISQISSTLDSLLTQVNDAYRFLQSQDGPHQLILIHGAGGYGHPPAKQYLVKQGWRNNQSSLSTDKNGSAITIKKQHALTEQDQKFGFSATRRQVLDLHQQLLQRLQSFGLPVVTVSAFDHVQTKAGEPTAESSRRLALRVQHLLSQGFLPLLFGDAVLDLAWGSTILSGDVIMYQLAMYLPYGVDRCVFVTDVPGIFTGDPKKAAQEKGGVTLIKHIPVGFEVAGEHDGKLVLPPDDGDNNEGVADVTGGMNGKIKWTKKIILDSTVSEVVVCQAGSSEMYHVITLAPISVSPGTGDDNNSDMATSLNNLSLTLFTRNKTPPLLHTSLLSSPLLHYVIFAFTLYHFTH